MENKGNKRREWVKTAAIVFLSVLLVLTFFSNTIMNWSLPEVAAQYVESGTITAKIRGSGVVESQDPYEVTVKETRTVASVAVREGDRVEEGDVLLYLEDKESAELENLRKELEAAEKAVEDAQDQVKDAQNDMRTFLLEQEIAILKGEMSESVLINGQSGNVSSLAEYQTRIAAIDVQIEQYKALVDAADRKLAELNETKRQIGAYTPDTSTEKRKVEDAQAAYDAANAEVRSVESSITSLQQEMAANDRIIQDYRYGKLESVSGSDTVLAVTEEQYQTAVANNAVLENQVAGYKKTLESKKEALPALRDALDKAQRELENKGNVNAVNQINIEKEIETWETEKKARVELQEKAEAERAQLIVDITGELQLDNALDDRRAQIAKLREAVEEAKEHVAEIENKILEEEEKSVGAVVKAPIAGTVTSINATAGREISAAEAVAVMQPKGQGYTMSFSVTNDQAKRLSVGDRAELVNAWYYNDMDIVLKRIMADKTDPSQKKLLVFDVSGDVTAGQNLNVSVGQKSATYDMIVPNSAIREDNNGKFVLVVESKSSPLGNRYYAARRDVEVLASDDTKSAITGVMEGWEFVITTSNAPVEAGQLIRLSDN